MYYLIFRKAKFKKIESLRAEANAFSAPSKNSWTTFNITIRRYIIYYVKIQLLIGSKPIVKVRPIIVAISWAGGNIILFLPTQAITAETATLLDSKTPEIKVSDQSTFFAID